MKIKISVVSMYRESSIFYFEILSLIGESTALNFSAKIVMFFSIAYLTCLHFRV